jgi:hypothetical protein
VSDRGCPLATPLNGPLMARRSARDLVFLARRARPARLIIPSAVDPPEGEAIQGQRYQMERPASRNGHACNWTAVALVGGSLVVSELGQPCQTTWMISTTRRYSTIRYVIIPAPPSPKV